MANCTEQQQAFEAANQAALDAYDTEASAATAVEDANQAVVDSQTALDAANASAVTAEANYEASVTAANEASQAAGAAYDDYLECKRTGGETAEPLPETAFFRQVRRTPKRCMVTV